MFKEKVNAFLLKYGMSQESINLKKNCSIFEEEMERGLNDNIDKSGSSLMMIPTYISMDRDIPLNEPVIVIDAGGTNFRVCVVSFDNSKKPVIDDFRVYPMPGTKGLLSRDEFFDTMASYIEPVINKSNKIAFCFSYPTVIQPNKDGRLVKFSKEVKVNDVDGELIGANLLKAIEKRGHNANKSIVLLNDTVATLLGGKAAYPDSVFDSYIGFILGTGTNTSYIEKCSNIKKVPEIVAIDSSMLINIESGDYGKAPRGIIDIEFDSGTVNPGSFTFEKAISGAYQGGIMLAVIRKAVVEGIFSDTAAKKLMDIKELSSKEIDDFLYFPYGSNALAACFDNDDDREVMYWLIDGIFERAAKLVTFNITAVMLKTGKGKNPVRPVCVTADGSTFYKSKMFRGKLDYYIRTFTNEELGLFCEFVKAENGNLVGTAIAGLVN